MAQAITNTLTDITAPVNYVMMKGLLSAARKRLPFFNGTVPGVLEKAGGSFSVQWERIANLAAVTTALTQSASNLAFGNVRTAVSPTVSRLSVATAKYGNAIILTEEVDLVQVNVRAAKLLETLGANAGESLNVLMKTVMQSGLTVKRNGGGVSTITSIVTAISSNDIKYAVNQINRNSGLKFTSMGTGSVNVGSSPIRDSYFGICHPDVEEDIRGISGFVGVQTYGGYMDTEPGEFGTVNGVRWCTSELSSLVNTTGATNGIGGNASTNALRYGLTKTACDVYDSFIYAKECIGSVGLGEQHAKEIYQMYDRVPAVQLIKKEVGSSGVGDMFNEIGSLAWKAWFAGKVLNTSWGVRIRTGASKLT